MSFSYMILCGPESPVETWGLSERTGVVSFDGEMILDELRCNPVWCGGEFVLRLKMSVTSKCHCVTYQKCP